MTASSIAAAGPAAQGVVDAAELPNFKHLFRWELDAIPRRPIFWLVLVILCGTFVWGALNNAALHAAQNHSLRLAAQEDAEWQQDLKRRAQRYSQPSSEPLQYWQDPTDVDAFSRYFLRKTAAKPHLPLSVLSVGQSDLMPYQLPMKLETPFGVAPVYDFEHPRGLALGLFDLSFALVFFLPIGVVLLVSMLGAFERDHGILRFVAAQSVSPRMLLGTRMLALSVWLLPAIALALIVALAIARAPVAADGWGLLAMLALIIAYSMMWLALGYLVLMFQQGAAGTAGLLIALWALFAIVVPQAATLAGTLLNATSSHILYVDELRQADEQVLDGSASWNATIARWLATRPEPRAAVVDPSKLTAAAHYVFAAPEREALLRPSWEAMRAHRAAAARWTPMVEWLSPPVALQHALSTLAGTDSQRHERFMTSAREYQLELRDLIYPLVKEQIVNPRPRQCAGCPGRLTFTDYDRVPDYRFPVESSTDRVATVMPWVAFFVLLSVALTQLAQRRGRAWRAQDLQ